MDPRRLFPRVPLSMLVQFRLDDYEEFMREYAVNISEGGMFVRTEEPREEGAMLYLQFRLKAGDILIEGLGKVVHKNPPDHPNPGMGIEFVNLEPASKRLIESIVRERQQEVVG